MTQWGTDGNHFLAHKGPRRGKSKISPDDPRLLVGLQRTRSPQARPLATLFGGEGQVPTTTIPFTPETIKVPATVIDGRGIERVLPERPVALEPLPPAPALAAAPESLDERLLAFLVGGPRTTGQLVRAGGVRAKSTLAALAVLLEEGIIVCATGPRGARSYSLAGVLYHPE